MPTSLPFPALESANLPAKSDPVSPDVKALLGKPKTRQEFTSAFKQASVKAEVVRKPDFSAAKKSPKTISEPSSREDAEPDAAEGTPSKSETPLDASVLQSMAGVVPPVQLDPTTVSVANDEGLATDGSTLGTEATNTAGEGTAKESTTTPASVGFSTTFGGTWRRLKQTDAEATAVDSGAGSDEGANSKTEVNGLGQKGQVAFDGAVGNPAGSPSDVNPLATVAVAQGVQPSAIQSSKEADNAAQLSSLGKRRPDPANVRGEKKPRDASEVAADGADAGTPSETMGTLASLLPEEAASAVTASRDLSSKAGADGSSVGTDDPQASKLLPAGLGEKFAALREKGVAVEVSGGNSSNGVRKNNLLTADNKQVKTSAQKIGTDTANQGETTMFNLRQPAEFLARSIAPVIGAHLSSDSRVETASSQVQQSNAAKATQVVNDIHELAHSLPTESRKSVELRFDFGHQERLSVKVEMRDGTVHTTFNASSRELTETVNTAWNNQPIAADSSVKLADPVFATAPVENKGFSLDSGNGKGQQERQQAAQDEGSGSRALPSFFRSGNSTTSVKSSTPVVASDRHLQAFA